MKGRILQKHQDNKTEINTGSYRFSLSRSRNFGNSYKVSAEKRKREKVVIWWGHQSTVRTMHEQKAFQEL